MSHIRACGVAQVPTPICNLDGATFFDADGYVWQLEPWMPGTADFLTRPSENRLRAALTCLAHWHRAATTFEARGSEQGWFFTSPSAPSPGLAERAREIARWDPPARRFVEGRLAASSANDVVPLCREILDGFGRAAPRIAAQLALGLEASVPLAPCLRDVWHDHVLFTGDSVTGLIDPHSARSDSVATDLARLLGSLVGDDRRAWEIGIDAYQKIRPLSVAERALVELFDQTVVLLSGMTWLDWLWVEGRVFEDREKVLGRLRAITARLNVLASR